MLIGFIEFVVLIERGWSTELGAQREIILNFEYLIFNEAVIKWESGAESGKPIAYSLRAVAFLAFPARLAFSTITD